MSAFVPFFVLLAAAAEPVALPTGHAGSVDALDLSADAGRLLTGGDTGDVRLWDTRDGALLAAGYPHDRTRAVAIAGDGSVLSCGLSAVVRATAVSGAWLEAGRWKTEGPCVGIGVALEGRGVVVAVGPTVLVFRPGRVGPVQRIQIEGKDIAAMAVAPNAERAAVVTLDGVVEVVDLETGKSLMRRAAKVGENAGSGASVAWAEAGDSVAVLTANGLEVLRISKARVVAARPADRSLPGGLAWTSRGLLSFTTASGLVALSSGSVLGQFEAAPTRAVALSDDGETLAMGFADGRVSVRDLGAEPLAATGRARKGTPAPPPAPATSAPLAPDRDLGTHARRIAALVFSADGSKLFGATTGGAGPAIVQWSAATGEEHGRWAGGGGALAASQDGRWLAAEETAAGTTTVRAVGSGEVRQTFASGPVFELGFEFSDRLAAILPLGLRVWSLADGQLIWEGAALFPKTQNAPDAHLSVDGDAIVRSSRVLRGATATDTHEVSVWDLKGCTDCARVDWRLGNVDLYPIRFAAVHERYWSDAAEQWIEFISPQQTLWKLDGQRPPVQTGPAIDGPALRTTLGCTPKLELCVATLKDLGLPIAFSPREGTVGPPLLGARKPMDVNQVVSAVSPDGRWFAYADAEGIIELWDVETGVHRVMFAL